MLAVALPVLVSSVLAGYARPLPAPAWRGDLTLTLRGEGVIYQPLSQGGRITVTWKVDRVAKGIVVLDQTFKGAGIARTENSRDTARYETWIASRAQPLEMTVNDTGSYAGPVGTARTYALDVARYSCPAKDATGGRAQIRSGILQFDRVNGTYTFETPRLISRCDVSYLRTPTKGPPDWMARGPFEMERGNLDLEFGMVSKLDPLEGWRLLSGPASPDATEITLSRTLTFQWMNQTETGKAPVTGELQLVLRRSP